MDESVIGGQELGLVDAKDLDEWVSVMRDLPKIHVMDNDCHGVDENNVYMMWFQKKIFSKIQNWFGQDLKLVFGMFLNENQPWGVHTDAIHVKDRPERAPAISFVIPYSVDHDPALVSKSSTIVFEQGGMDNPDIFALPDRDSDPNSALGIYQSHLSHNPIEEVKKLTIQGIYQWHPGSIIYWNSLYFHDSDNFLANGFQNKQALVMHTYRRV